VNGEQRELHNKCRILYSLYSTSRHNSLCDLPFCGKGVLLAITHFGVVAMP